MDIPHHIGEKFYPFSHFIGYRPATFNDRTRFLPQYRDKPWVKKTENVILTFLGAWTALTFIALAARAAPFQARNVPTIVGSFGAEAVLLYAAHNSPMAQPRNIVFSMPVSALIGMGVGKLFAMQDDTRFPSEYGKQWASSSTAVALSLLVTQELSVPHPPGGATALLAASNQQIFDLGWFYPGYVLTGSAIMLGWGLIINNIGRRRYPQYWLSADLVRKDEHASEKQQMNTAPGSAKTAERQA
ncbi:hypothetical protein NliqN6_1247 [Naganishia liquefaciens]|uniref:HPP transmembrane region domain-containing protein n=1 Tax=Naganishia liquefaciens TaxID=104408 RepID=A0A8H3TPJ9_9TREE|nr:hypothetical protein NliqN6_1247 [Naganishia liquefaciens]